MDNPLISVILLALAASIMPIQFGMEIVIFGEEDGLKKSGSLLSGITLFRVLVILFIGVVFPGILNVLENLLENFSTWASSAVEQLKEGIVSGEHILFDALMIMAGIMLLIQAVRRFRNPKPSEAAGVPKSAGVQIQSKGIKGLLLLGFTWTAVSVNQWIFTTAAVGQILSFSQTIAIRIIMAALFILLASLMVALPFFLYLIRPKSAQTNIAKINNWFGKAIPFIVFALMSVIGLYFIVSGIIGAMDYF